MLLLFYYSLPLIPFLDTETIWRGVEELDQDLADDITPGGDVAFSSYPFIGAVFNAQFKRQTCTGIIVSDKMVLAAGYCVCQEETMVDPFHISVLAGVVDMRNHEDGQWRYAVSITASKIMYQNRPSLVLIKVNTPFCITYNVKPIQVKRERFTGSSVCTAVTWRFHDKFNRLLLKSLVLKEYTVLMKSNVQCRSSYFMFSKPDFKELDFICMTRILRTQDLDHDCAGIDGSLTFCNETGTLYPTGIASTYMGNSICGRRSILYTFYDIGIYGNWIFQEI